MTDGFLEPWIAGWICLSAPVAPNGRGGGDPFGVLIVLMTSALVIAIWGVARDRLVAIVGAALSNVCGSVGC